MREITADVMPLYAVPEEDAQKFIKWIWDVRQKVCFDADTLAYPRSCMTMAKIDGETSLMIPLQPVLMFESLARKPGLSNRETAVCMLRIGESVEDIAKLTGHAEGYFFTNDYPEVLACSKNGWTVYLHDPEKGVWMMKRKFNSQGRTTNADND